MHCRAPEEVARRALIFSAMDFRASLEVTDHPRVSEIAARLLPWLIDAGCEGDIDKIEYRILNTPLGGLSESEKVDVKWACESLCQMLWALKIIEHFPYLHGFDYAVLQGTLCPFQTDPVNFIKTASLRSMDELIHNAKTINLLVAVLRERRVPSPASKAIIRRIQLQTLHKVGIEAADQDLQDARSLISDCTDDQLKGIAGLASIRVPAALWMFRTTSNFWEHEDEQ